MLKTAIEIEGLVRILKDGDPSAECVALLREKIAELSELSENYEMPGETTTQSEAHDLEAHSSDMGTDDNAGHLGEEPLPVSDDILLFSDEEPQQDKDKTDEPDEETSAKPAQVSDGAATDLKKYFSLNDRYLYSRELFGGDMKMFDSTLKFLEGIKDFSDIEDYFYSELEWNPEDANVASFLEILRPHFND